MSSLSSEAVFETDAAEYIDTQTWQEFFLQSGPEGTEVFQQKLKSTVNQLASVLAAEDKPAPTENARQMGEQVALQGEIGLAGIHLEALLQQALPLLVKGAVRVDHPHCAAHLHCPPLIPALAAEIVLTTLNQSMDSWDQAPAATHIEQHMVDWLCDQLGYSTAADGSFTSGGTQSNLMGLLLARDKAMNALQNDSRWVQQQGVINHRFANFKVLCSRTAHFSIAKSCALLGLGAQAVIAVDTDAEGAMDMAALQHELQTLKESQQQVLAIVATAGTTDQGAIDPIDAMATIAQEQGCWLHVDAAYGGALLFSSHRHRLKGIEQADSVTVDFHKMFFQPVSCSALLVKDRQNLAPLCFHADYLSREGDSEPNLVDKSMSTTRRFDALKLWLSFRNLGLKNFTAMVDGLIDLTQAVADLIVERKEFILLSQPSISTVLFRLAPEAWHSDAFHQQLRRHLLQTGQAVIAETRIDGDVCLKLTLLNPCTQIADIDALLDIIINAAEELSAS
ncbi:hypothetical protein R50073_21070 [Maricurvus nonylphenolicus]|uniref:pyridoxal phosphate-dependent decarboxylase family protein n=1 Tax=Maricurvus nonylphenolicus TaxID=1008307 RepID=UPI0036F2397B